MTNVNIDELLDIGNSQKPDSKVALQQDGVTFKAPERPNPPRQVNVTSQAQLEAEFGVNIEIPDALNVTIEVDESFTLTKPIKVGDNSGVFIHGSTANTSITYTGPGAMIQNTNPANPLRTVIFDTILIAGDGTNSLLDIIGIANTSTFFTDRFSMTNFAFLGNVDMAIIDIEGTASIENGNGFIFKNTLSLVLSKVIVIQNSFDGFTLGSFITPISTGYISYTNVRFVGSVTATGCSLIFVDPNSLTTVRYVLTQVDKLFYDLFQQGTDIAAIADAAASATSTKFDIIAHGLVVGQAVVLKNFTTFPGYNGTFIVTAVDGVNSVDIGVVFLGFDSSGTMSAKSLDSTDVLVDSSNNPGEPDSMSQAEARTTGTLEVDGSGGVDVPVVDLTPVSGDWIQDISTERFTIDLTTGIITYIGTEDKTFKIEYQLTAVPSSGGNQVINFDIHVAGVEQIKSRITVNTADVNVGQYIGGLFVLSPGDTIQLFKNNITNVANTDISVATVLITSS